MLKSVQKYSFESHTDLGSIGIEKPELAANYGRQSSIISTQQLNIV